MDATVTPCPLCGASQSSHFHNDQKRDYIRCNNCALVYVPPAQFLSLEEESAEYDKHQNSSDDPGYRQFLERLFKPLNARLAPKSQGLDFGCGPGPTLSVMFEEAGHHVNLYDPLYAHHEESLTSRYDFITTSEVVEHLHNPAKEFDRLWSILNPGGWLGIMTKLTLTPEAFSKWHYKNDLTHVCFFSIETMEWLANRWGAEYLQVDKDVTLLQKPL